MQKFYAYIFALYFASLGLSPLWGAHVHHNHERDESNSFTIQQAAVSSRNVLNRVDTDENDNCVRFCDDCTIESLLGHLLEHKTFFGQSNLILKSQFLQKFLGHQVSAENLLFRKFQFVAFTTTIPPPLPKVWHIQTSTPRGPPLV